MNHDKNVTTTIGHLIDGKLVADTERTQPVFNPATGQSTTSVALASKATVEAAIASAEAAFPAWRNTPPLKRARVMSKLKVLLEENADKIAALITAEHGKVLSDAHGELQRGIENVEYASYAPQLLKGEHSRNVGPNIDSWSEFQPLGVVAGITPFNFPVMVPLWMWPMAVVCGNTFVLKPSERDPSSTLFIAELALQAGLPPGVLNVVQGDKEAVDFLLNDNRVKAVSFVGSTPIAEYVYRTGCAAGKRVQALGGAKNHAVVMPDADLDNAVAALMGAAYGSCGERCMAVPLAVCVGDEVADQLAEKLLAAIGNMKVGVGTDNSSDMGPLITQQHFEKVKGYVDQGVNADNERSVLAIGAMRSQLETIDRQASERGLRVRGFVPVALGAEHIASEKGALSAVMVEECATGYAIDMVQNGRLVYSRLTPSGASLEAEIHRAGVASGTEPERRFDCGSNQNPQTAFTQLIERGISWPSALIELPERVAARHKKEVAALGRGAVLMMIAAALVAYFVYNERAEKASIVDNRERAMNNYVQTRTRKSDSIILETNELMTMANEIARATSPGQNASDVLKVISGSTPANLWLSAVSFERGKPFTIRGTALDDAAVQTYLANLSNLDRFRDVKLVFANNAMIESTSVIQFSISGVAVGNLPPLKTKVRRERSEQ